MTDIQIGFVFVGGLVIAAGVFVRGLSWVRAVIFEDEPDTYERQQQLAAAAGVVKPFRRTR